MFLLFVLAHPHYTDLRLFPSPLNHYELYQTMHKAQAVPSFCGIRMGRLTCDTVSTFVVYIVGRGAETTRQGTGPGVRDVSIGLGRLFAFVTALPPAVFANSSLRF